MIQHVVVEIRKFERHARHPSFSQEVETQRKNRAVPNRDRCASPSIEAARASRPRRGALSPISSFTQSTIACIVSAVPFHMTPQRLIARIPYLNINADLTVPHDNGARCHIFATQSTDFHRVRDRTEAQFALRLPTGTAAS